ncbi:hypothetical protein EYR40_003752 [Pleurotus pulmonarius]|nr:hypothetical protein EYR36_007673 [Pleurotus pulmonarius]KAF4604969.1 hypothetical protein EYR40_003752 [Pleurotus pulmonarius]KAF4606463.1 hypothetical protein EYR38_000517 [Pleurotus pulmonarius]
MAKKKAPIPESHLILPTHSTSQTASIVDTHTHIASTFEAYRHKYKEGKFETVFDFIKGVTANRNVDAVVDVWCEAPIRKLWKEFADSAVTEEDRIKNWGGLEYWFVMGVHPHEAKHYTDEVEEELLQAMEHPRCVGWGEMGLDYHYDLSPRDVQQAVFTRQLKHAVRLGKPLTIHTREANEDTERILKEEVPKDHKIHIHCFTDEPAFALRLLEHFSNLYIGVTGVVTYTSNENTSGAVYQMSQGSSDNLRILLETDAPYMVPANIYDTLTTIKGKLPICHTAMIPWTADFVANFLGGEWTSEKVMKISRENARSVYGV